MSNRSRFVIAVQDYKAPGEGSSFLSFVKGDLLILEEENTGETVLNNGWCIGNNIIKNPALDLISLRLTNNIYFQNLKVDVSAQKIAVIFRLKPYTCCQH